MNLDTVEITVVVRPRPGTLSIEVRGDVDQFSLPGLRGALQTAVAEHPELIEVDLSGVTFFCCAAAHALAEARRAGGARVAVVGAAPVVGRVLDLCGLPLQVATPSR